MLTPVGGVFPADLALVLAAEADAGGIARRLEAVAAVVLDARVSVLIGGPPEASGHAESGGRGLRLAMIWEDVELGVLGCVRADAAPCFEEQDVAHARLLAAHGALALGQAAGREQHERTECQLARQEALARASTALVALADDDGQPSFVNSRAGEIGLDLDGGLWSVLAQGSGIDVEQVRRAVAAEGSWSGDVGLQTASWAGIVHTAIFALRDQDTGVGLGTGWIAEDVTALRQTAIALLEANAGLQRFQALVEASSDFIAIAALDGSVMYVNPAGRAQIEMPEDLDVTTTTIVDYLTPEGIEASLQREQPAVQAEGHWEGESTLRHYVTGRAIPVAIASFLMLDAESGEPFALATVQRDISDRMAYEHSLRQLADQRQALVHRLVRAQAEERAEIANDVHDDPVQALAAVDLRLGLLARKLGDQAPHLLADLAPVQDSVTGATRRLRGLVFNLQPPDFDKGLTHALEQAARDIFDGSSTNWTVCSHDEPPAPDATRAVAYRVAREAMTNARKHARANTLVVTVAGREGGLQVSISDDGVGLPDGPLASSPGHHGLGSMRDRAEIAGGRWELAERPEGGIEVVCWLPLVDPGVSPGPAPR